MSNIGRLGYVVSYSGIMLLALSIPGAYAYGLDYINIGLLAVAGILLVVGSPLLFGEPYVRSSGWRFSSIKRRYRRLLEDD